MDRRLNALDADRTRGEPLGVPWEDVLRQLRTFAGPPGKTDRYTVIGIDLFAGRSLAAKKALYQAIVRELAPFGIPADHVTVVLRETQAENWGIRGGIPASDVDLGFKIDV